MKEKELRLALVCYGGVSLAVYMHGATKELLKVVRASRTYHSVPTAEARRDARYESVRNRTADPEIDTEAVYFDLLKEIGQHLDLRVVIDIISGASAGGINGVVLARALAHDLPITSLRKVWLEAADVSELLGKRSASKVWSKWYLRPFIWAFTLRQVPDDPEMRRKLSRFFRSRWFRPPFDGENLSRVLLTAIDGMGDPARPRASLVPPGQRLDLFVTVTDYYGYLQHIPTHDPPMVAEREHRHMLKFRYDRLAGGGEESDFTRENVASLVFAGRASSSFPGAFRPAQIREIEKVAADLGKPWTTKEGFLATNFRRYRQAGSDPHKTSFVDGAVLNNKPFASAISAIRGRPAYRQVDRRLVYIDPDPEQPPPPPDGRVPNWFRTLKGALSDIPRNEPVFGDLEWINSYNQRVRRIKAIIDEARPQVVQLVRELAGNALDQPLTTDTLGVWREAANARAAEEAGFVYDGYVRLKLASVLEYLSGLAAEMAGFPTASPTAARIAVVLRTWATARQVLPPPGTVPRSGNVTTGEPPPWVRFVLRFDLAFRQRRLAFVIRSLNQLYGHIGDVGFDGVTTEKLDRLKADFYSAMDAMRRFNDFDFADQSLLNRFEALFSPLSRSDDLLEKDWFDPEAFVARDGAKIDQAIEALDAAINLRGLNRRVDAIIAALTSESVGTAARRELLISYIGFAFWDMLTFSLTSWRDAGEYEEIRVDRISPDDADSIRQGGAPATLKGIDFSHFGAFFSRRNRENDYLWGRLHAAERVIDILVDAAGQGGDEPAIDVMAYKRRAFATILNAEEKELGAVSELIATLRAEIARIH